jgi:hypothetical protein
MKSKSSIVDLHGDHAEWAEKLFFYNDEIAIMQSRLEEIIRKNSSQEVKMKVEHFQNQLIIQSSTIEMLKEMIEKDELLVETEADKHSSRAAGKSHVEERKEMAAFENNFKALRKELSDFLLKWM